jgi:hypothetical protein
MTKPILFVDTNFVVDLFGRITFDADSGANALYALSEKYDIRVTTTVLNELDQPGSPSALLPVA